MPKQFDVKDWTRAHEGFRDDVYLDSLGRKTVGVGHLITPDSPFNNFQVGDRVNPAFLEKLYDDDFSKHAKMAEDVFPEFHRHPSHVQEALINMTFQLGNKPKKWKDMQHNLKRALETGDYAPVAAAAADSKWYRDQTPQRARSVLDRLAGGSEYAYTPDDTAWSDDTSDKRYGSFEKAGEKPVPPPVARPARPQDPGMDFLAQAEAMPELEVQEDFLAQAEAMPELVVEEQAPLMVMPQTEIKHYDANTELLPGQEAMAPAPPPVAEAAPLYDDPELDAYHRRNQTGLYGDPIGLAWGTAQASTTGGSNNFIPEYPANQALKGYGDGNWNVGLSEGLYNDIKEYAEKSQDWNELKRQQALLRNYQRTWAYAPQEAAQLREMDLIRRFQNESGYVPGYAYGAMTNPEAGPSDTVPAMLTPGEAVIPASVAMDEDFQPLIKEMVNEGRERNRMAEAEGIPVNHPAVPGLADGTLDSKISKIYKEGYTAPGQAYAIAKSKGYQGGTEMIPKPMGAPPKYNIEEPDHSRFDQAEMGQGTSMMMTNAKHKQAIANKEGAQAQKMDHMKQTDMYKLQMDAMKGDQKLAQEQQKKAMEMDMKLMEADVDSEVARRKQEALTTSMSGYGLTPPPMEQGAPPMQGFADGDDWINDPAATGGTIESGFNPMMWQDAASPEQVATYEALQGFSPVHGYQDDWQNDPAALGGTIESGWDPYKWQDAGGYAEATGYAPMDEMMARPADWAYEPASPWPTAEGYADGLTGVAAQADAIRRLQAAGVSMEDISKYLKDEIGALGATATPPSVPQVSAVPEQQAAVEANPAVQAAQQAAAANAHRINATRDVARQAFGAEEEARAWQSGIDKLKGYADGWFGPTVEGTQGDTSALEQQQALADQLRGVPPVDAGGPPPTPITEMHAMDLTGRQDPEAAAELERRGYKRQGGRWLAGEQVVNEQTAPVIDELRAKVEAGGQLTPEEQVKVANFAQAKEEAKDVDAQANEAAQQEVVEQQRMKDEALAKTNEQRASLGLDPLPATATVDPTTTPDEVDDETTKNATDAATNADPEQKKEWYEHVGGWFKDAFGTLMNEQGLAEAVIVYGANRLLGYDNDTAGQQALGWYKNKLNQEQAAQADLKKRELDLEFAQREAGIAAPADAAKLRREQVEKGRKHGEEVAKAALANVGTRTVDKGGYSSKENIITLTDKAAGGQFEKFLTELAPAGAPIDHNAPGVTQAMDNAVRAAVAHAKETGEDVQDLTPFLWAAYVPESSGRGAADFKGIPAKRMTELTSRIPVPAGQSKGTAIQNSIRDLQMAYAKLAQVNPKAFAEYEAKKPNGFYNFARERLDKLGKSNATEGYADGGQIQGYADGWFSRLIEGAFKHPSERKGMSGQGRYASSYKPKPAPAPKPPPPHDSRRNS